LYPIGRSKRDAVIVAWRAFLSGEPHVSFGIDYGLIGHSSLDGDRDDPNDRSSGAHSLGPLKHGGVAGEDHPALARSIPHQNAPSGQIDGVAEPRRTGGVAILGAGREGDRGRQQEAQTHAGAREKSGLVVLSHGSSQDTTWRFSADGLPWPNRD
jgi:hypothetical protein